ncbi:hypothetical protein FKG96_06225 [Olivibacter sp. LS-1]|uniref:hypothetical protein n=1 Tax=unclassified Olivibacter TaxID=2632301 RepID=UPI0011EAB9BC|nr:MULTISPECIES: hypothetical protein [unclassified Olivibacter]MDM8176934.1 hypothetical protein [Olivibacter sp. 47]QEL00422.1 hypothetical protein FKG96_06225 [Olivibacter sp. LS-1]
MNTITDKKENKIMIRFFIKRKAISPDKIIGSENSSGHIHQCRRFLVIAFALVCSFRVSAQTNRFPSDGNTGIGTFNPTAKLHIVEGNNTFRFNRGALNVTPNISIGTSGGKSLAVLSGLNGTASVFDNTGTFMIAGDTKANIDGGGSSGGTPYLTVTGGGYVGIGTVNPQELLTVNGIIKSREVKVESGVWPDYVFAAGYKMPGLAEVEKYIREHGHLPGIPGKEEVAREGVGLAEMNRKLLEKVEEITLLLIENEKIRESQAREMKEQAARIDRLEDLLTTGKRR